MERQSRKLDYASAKSRILKYCTYQERCHKEVRSKLYTFGLAPAEIEQILSELIELNFLNEERFSRSFAGGKFRTKGWGRNRIKRELTIRQISPYCINAALSEIQPSDYQQTLNNIIKIKLRQYAGSNSYAVNNKVATYCIGRGFESDLVWASIRSISPIK